MKKNKKIEDIPQTGGLLIGECISLGLCKTKQRFEILKLWVVSAIGAYGTVFGVISLFGISCGVFQIGIVTLAAVLISALVFSSKKYLIPSLLLAALLLICLFALPQYDLGIGFKYFVNRIIEKASLSITEFYIPRKADVYACSTLFISVFSVAVSYLVCFAVIAKKSFALSFIFTFPLIEIGLFFGIAPDYKAFALLLSFWLSAVVLESSNYRKYIGTPSGDFVRKGNTFIPKYGMKKRVDSSSAMCMLILTFAVFTVSAFSAAVFDIKRPDSVNQLRYTLKYDILHMSLDDIKNRIENNVKNSNYADIRSGDLEFTDTDMLMLKFESRLTDNVYLKSYCGSVYDSSGWGEFDDSTLDELSKLDKNFEDICYPQDMLWNYLRSNHPDLQQSGVTVDVINADVDYCYMPYASNPSVSTRYYADSVSFANSFVLGESNAKASYSYDFLSTDFEELLLWYCTGSNAENATNSELAEYDDFVKQNYLSLPNNDRLLSLYEDEDFAKIVGQYRSGNSDIYQTLCDIRSYIHDNASYTLSPGDTPKDEDVVYYFLKDNHKGYCVHYASAGAVLTRMAGIPSRYCVGYIAKSSKFNLLNKQGSGYSFMLKDDSAHAWVEIYIAGLGWIPFEFTEGYAQQSVTTPAQTTAVTTTKAKTSRATSHTAKGSTVETTSTAISSENPTALSQNDHEYSGAQKVVATVFAIFVIISFFVVIIIMRSRQVAILRRKKSMRTQSYAQNTVNAYRYIVDLLEFNDILVLGRTPLEYAESVESQCDFFESGQLVLACDFAMKAAFGSRHLTKDESDAVRKLSDTVAKSVYASSSKINKLKMKYIRRLI